MLQFYGACLKTEGAIMVLEYMAGGDLMEAIAQDKNGELKWMRRGHLIALDLARALVFLHRNKVGCVLGCEDAVRLRHESSAAI